MAKITFAIVKEDSEIQPATMESIIAVIKASLSNGYSVFLAEHFRVRDDKNRTCAIDVENRVCGRVIGTVIFFSRKEAEFWARQFPILKRVILITRKERTSPRNRKGEILLRVGEKIVVVNVKDVGDDFIQKFVV